MIKKGIFRQPLIGSNAATDIFSWKTPVAVLLGVFLAHWSIGQLFPQQEREKFVRWVGPTIAAAQHHPPPINVLLMGSSRVYRGLSPEVIEEEASILGESLSVFNHAWPNMTLLEIQSIVRKMDLSDVDRVVFEPSMHSQWVINNPTSLRAFTFFTPTNTWTHLSYLSCAGLSYQESVPSAYYATMAMFSSLLGRGLLREYLFPRAMPDSALPKGYQPLDAETEPTFVQRRLKFQQQVERYNKRRGQLKKTPVKEPNSCQVEALEQTIALIERKGARAHVLFPPTLRMAKEYNGLYEAAKKKNLSILSYNIDRAGQLYAASLRYDEEHLNAEGAQVWSKMFASDIVRLYQSSEN